MVTRGSANSHDASGGRRRDRRGQGGLRQRRKAGAADRGGDAERRVLPDLGSRRFRVALPSDGKRPEARNLFPYSSGFRFVVFMVGPDSESVMPADLDVQSAMAEMEAKAPGAAARMEPNNPGMHKSDTVDYVVVLSGEVWLELDDGQETHLRMGDLVVQNGTRHAWRNKSTAPCTLGRRAGLSSPPDVAGSGSTVDCLVRRRGFEPPRGCPH